MATVFVPRFWPLWQSPKITRFDYQAVDGSLAPISSVFSYDKSTDSMLYDDYNEKAVWQDRWYYRFTPGVGIEEWRDDYPHQTAWWTKLFGTTKKVVFSQPIFWGNTLELGQTITTKATLNCLGSTPPQYGSCTQTVTAETVLSQFVNSHGVAYSDVFVFSYQQTWNGKPLGARYWMVAGLGPVSVQWISGQIETSRLDSSVTFS